MSWSDDHLTLVNQIKSSKATLKIVLKTRDEVELLEQWILWHIDIVGIENIIVFDNGSENRIIFDIYKRFPSLKVCTYIGNLDSIHHKQSYKLLYDALDQSAQYYTFIDTDEFMTLVVDANTHDRRKIQSFLEENNHIEVFPGVRLDNRPGLRENFYVSRWSNIYCGAALLWGKPIVKSMIDLKCESWLHNCWIKNYQGKRSRNNIFILHFNQLYYERQKRIHLMKFISKGRVPVGTTVDEIVNNMIPKEGLSDETRKLFSEFRIFVRSGGADWQNRQEPPYRGIVKFEISGSIAHATATESNDFQKFLDDECIFSRTLACWNEQQKPVEA